MKKMGFTGKPSPNNRDHQNWNTPPPPPPNSNSNMSFLFVFFPGEQPETNSTASSSSSILKKNNPNGTPSFPCFSSKRENSTHLLSRAQSTISICALLVFVTLLLFTLSTFEPSSSLYNNSSSSSRRQLIQFSPPNPHKNNGDGKLKKLKGFPAPSHALQGMGSLYRRGTKSMNDLIVAHVSESLNSHELRLFLRLFFGSALNSRADLLFLFPAKSPSLDNLILQENDSFFKLVDRYRELNSAGNSTEVPQFVKSGKDGKGGGGEPIWGGKIKSNSGDWNGTVGSARLSYGSVIGFDVDELDPENSLAGFLDHLPMSLRRWACYPMLLGRVRRYFKHIMLIDPKELLLVGDPMAKVRSSSVVSVHLSAVIATRHGKKNPERAHTKPASPAIIRGGARGIRRLSHAMLNEIVRAAGQKKKKSSVTEFGVFNQLVGNEFLLKNVKLIPPLTESTPELSSLAGSNPKEGGSSPGASPISSFTVVRRGNNNFDVNSPVLKHILCSSPLHYSVYSNCL